MDVKAITRHKLMSVEEIIMIMNEILKRDLGEKEYKKMEDKKVKKVKCINNRGESLCLTVGKEYPIIEKRGSVYFITNDFNVNGVFSTELFEQVEEKKEYTVMELLDFPVGTKFKDELGDIIEVIQANTTEKGLIIDGDMDCELKITTAWKRMRFTKVEEPKTVTFLEAVKAWENFKVIKSALTGNKYSKCLLNDKSIIFGLGIKVEETENKWIIE